MSEQEYIFKIIELAISTIATIGTIIGLIFCCKTIKRWKGTNKAKHKSIGNKY